MPLVDTVCQTCGFAASRDAGDTGGLCPRCLLRAALGPPPDVLPRAFGKYRLLEQLDRGGMGIVLTNWLRTVVRVFVSMPFLAQGRRVSF